MAAMSTPASVTRAVTSKDFNLVQGVHGARALCRIGGTFESVRHSVFHSSAIPAITNWSQRRCSYTPIMDASTTQTKKIARLNVKKRKTASLPAYTDASGNPLHISVFLQEPEGMECMLNTKALMRYESIGDGIFKCYLPPLEFLSFQVAPVIDLSVHAKDDCCEVDLISCKFEGSNLVRSQNERFSASLKNHLSWSGGTDGQQQNLHVRLELKVALEVYTQPFKSLPISAVQTPGTLILQALVDRLLPLFLDQLLTDYRAWAVSKGPQARLVQIATNGEESRS